jgi:hypothetical protein
LSPKKDAQKLIAKVQEQGWRVDDKGSAWLRYSPDGKTIVTIHKTPSDHRALKNAISRLKRGGFDPDA